MDTDVRIRRLVAALASRLWAAATLCYQLVAGVLFLAVTLGLTTAALGRRRLRAPVAWGYRLAAAACFGAVALGMTVVAFARRWTRRSLRALAGLGPLVRSVGRPARVGLLGRRLDVSAATLVVAPPLALSTAWWVGTGPGYRRVAGWVTGTWYGTEPELAVLLAAAALVGLAAASAAVNSGLLPSSLLVAAPLFGVAATRYGLETRTGVVSLPDAAVTAAGLALVIGLPLAAIGFCVGVAARRVARVLAGGAGPSSRPEGV